MGDKNILLWILLIGVFFITLYWHRSENRRLEREWRTKPPEPQWLVRFTKMRTLQLAITMALAVALIITYDWQLSTTRQQVNMLNEELAKGPENYIRSLVKKVPPAERKIPGYKKMQQEMMEIPDTRTEKEVSAQLEDIKNRYKEILTTHLFMQKCGKGSRNNSRVILNAMNKEILAARPRGRLTFNVVKEATDSYNKKYVKASCKDEGFPVLFEQYETYIKMLEKQYPLSQKKSPAKPKVPQG